MIINKNIQKQYIKLVSYLNKRKYSKIYYNDGFRGLQSKSGFGSDLPITDNIRKEIPKLITRYN
ncbi:hypothetical protein MHK_002031, partial [Candidatus Magnetomorum sp. HK-1]